MINSNNSIINDSLADMGIIYREIQFKKGTLFFCELLNGCSFNICFNNNRTIKIWSFIGTVSIRRAGTKYEWRGTADTSMRMGLEVTGDGDVNFYISDTLESKDIKEHIDQLIEWYSSIITNRIAAI